MSQAISQVKSPVAIISCGAQKRTESCAAGEMYIGSYFRTCLRYARSKAPDERIFILSAKYGLLRLCDVIEPYDTRIEKRQWKSLYLLNQARRRQIVVGDEGAPIITTCGAVYLRALRDALGGFCSIETPLHGVGGIGKQLAWLKANTKEGVERESNPTRTRCHRID